MHKQFLNKGKEPCSRYNIITKDDWAELKRVRLMPEFLAKSVRQSKLQKWNTPPHRMGVAGYYSKKLIWDK